MSSRCMLGCMLECSCSGGGQKESRLHSIVFKKALHDQLAQLASTPVDDTQESQSSQLTRLPSLHQHHHARPPCCCPARSESLSTLHPLFSRLIGHYCTQRIAAPSSSRAFASAVVTKRGESHCYTVCIRPSLTACQFSRFPSIHSTRRLCPGPLPP